jgi:hypothetical protein
VLGPTPFGKPDGAALQRHNTENSKQIFPEKKLCGSSPNCHLHVSVSDLYTSTPTIGLPILLQENVWTNPGNTVQLHKSPTDNMNVEIGTEVVQFIFWEYIIRIFVAVWVNLSSIFSTCFGLQQCADY